MAKNECENKHTDLIVLDNKDQILGDQWNKHIQDVGVTKKYLLKIVESWVWLKLMFYNFKKQKAVIIQKYLNQYTKLLSDVQIIPIKYKKEDIVIIL